jgi:integrase
VWLPIKTKMENYKNLQAHDANGDLKKSWYISYYFLNPKTGEFKRFRESGDVNRIKSAKQRKDALHSYRLAKQILLEKGWSPFDSVNLSNIYQKAGVLFTTIDEAINTVLIHKELHLESTSFKSYKSTNESFRSYLEKMGLLTLKAADINKKHINEFLDYRTKMGTISPRTRNNILINLKSLFSCMVDNEIIEVNPAIKIKKIAQTSTGNEVYTDGEIAKIEEWLKENDPYTLLFCRFIYFSMIRPIELTRLQVKDIDLKNRTIKIPAIKSKTKIAQTVPIMDKFWPFIMEMKLENFPPEYFLFSARKTPSPFPTTRDYFTDKFKRVKVALNLLDEQTMYSFKHTSVCKMLKNGAPESQIRKYSRHTTSEAFNAYARSFNLERADDLSKFL